MDAFIKEDAAIENDLTEDGEDEFIRAMQEDDEQ